METKENKLNSELRDEDLDAVAGGRILDWQPVDLICDPDPSQDDPNGFAKPGRPDKNPDFL